jgi:hypothetical protein
METDSNTAKAILASYEMESEWKLNNEQTKKIQDMWDNLKPGGLSRPFDNVSGLYRGFLIRTDKILFHVCNMSVFKIIDGIIERREDKFKKFERTVFNTAPENLLPDYIQMKVEEDHCEYFPGADFAKHTVPVNR